jgi:hypothetical protein
MHHRYSASIDVRAYACHEGNRLEFLLSAAFHKYGDAPRAARRPPRKARGGRIPAVFDRRATPRGRGPLYHLRVVFYGKE